MPNVSLQSNGSYWQARWRDSRGRAKGKSLGPKEKLSERGATVLCRQLQAELEARPGAAGGRSPTIGGLISRFLENASGLAPGTRELYEQTRKYLEAFFDPGLRADKLSRADAADWRSALAAGNLAKVNDRKHGKPSEGTVCRHVREAKAIMNAAVKDDLLASNPFDRLRSTSPPPEKRWAYIDREGLRRLMGACPNAGWRLLLALCRLAGLRQGEALALRWVDVDLERGRLVANAEVARDTKHKRREIPIDAELHGILEAVLIDGGAADLVVNGPHASNLWREFGAIARRAGVAAHARWCHTLRKNCETDWLERFPAMSVVSWLGHAPAVAQEHYYRPTEEQFAAATRPAECAQTVAQTDAADS